MIYFLHAPEAKRIKIGKSRSPLGRISSLIAACPFDAHLIGVMRGYTEEEAMMHRRFERHHAKGEWFHECDEIMIFVRNLPHTVREMLDLCPELDRRGSKVSTKTACPNCGVSRTRLTYYSGPFVPQKYCTDECEAKAIGRTIMHLDGATLFQNLINQKEKDNA